LFRFRPRFVDADCVVDVPVVADAVNVHAPLRSFGAPVVASNSAVLKLSVIGATAASAATLEAPLIVCDWVSVVLPGQAIVAETVFRI